MSSAIHIEARPDLLSTQEKEAIFRHFPDGVVVFDLETTGLSASVDEIVEVAAILVTPKGIRTFQTLVNPRRAIPPIVTAIHGITDEMVVEAPVLSSVLPEFIKFTESGPTGPAWFAHNARFDVGFIIAGHQQLNLAPPHANVYCSCQLSRVAFRGAPNHRLKTLATYLNISLEQHHRAFADTLATLHVLAQGLLRYEEILAQPLTDKSKKHPDIKAHSWVYSLSEFKRMGPASLPAHLQDLVPLLSAGQPTIEILYQGGSHKGEYRPIRAVAFLPMPQGPVLYAHCLLTDLYKSFSVRKIVAWRLAPQVKRPEEDL
ncbi:MAG TPA: hypothetical protein DCY86_05025 [Bdellovibrionales bacterium]|nr:hypothetical protein [Bdellovibrionales bacterium]